MEANTFIPIIQETEDSGVYGKFRNSQVYKDPFSKIINK